MYVITLPTKVKKSKKKDFQLNLNQYRNAHFRTLSAVKKEFTSIVKPLVAHLPPMQRIQIEYYLFVGSRQTCDVANVCTVVDKFFQDVLTHMGIIEDDNYHIVPEVSFKYGGYDKDEARVEAHIIPIDNQKSNPEKDDAMQLKITEREIHKAIVGYVNKLGLNTAGKSVTIDLQATRGPEGYTAVIDVTDGGSDENQPVSEPDVGEVVEESQGRRGGYPQREETDEIPEEEVTQAPVEAEKVAEKAEPVEEAKPTSTGSLFGELKRPTNESK